MLQLLLKHSRYRSYLDWIKAHPRLIEALLEQVYGISGVIYILATEEENSAEAIIKAISAIIPEKKEAIMTAAQQLRQEGIQQGMQQGMQTKSLEIAKNMLLQLH
ncbi:MAG: hypothetical protein ROO73_02255 [Roseivirga sp.]